MKKLRVKLADQPRDERGRVENDKKELSIYSISFIGLVNRYNNVITG